MAEEKMIDTSRFKPHVYDNRIFLDFEIRKHFGYSIDRSMFRYYEALHSFLKDNPNIKVYLTNDSSFRNFEYFGNNLLVNVDDFISFCYNIGHSKRDKGRVKAFFGQHLALSKINSTAEERSEFIKANITEKELIHVLQTLSKDKQESILEAIFQLQPDVENNSTTLTSENFIQIFTRFLNYNSLQNSILQNLPRIHINTLKELKSFVANNLDKSEKHFQDWIDEEKGKYRKQRCLIFGVEYIDPKREGEIMGRKRFDILATQNSEYHIIIELKSPRAEIFEIEERRNHNDGVTTTYRLSDDLSRAIPQILGYKKWYKGLSCEKVKELGIQKRKEVLECIIVIGQRKEDSEWRQNMTALCEAINVKIWTYNDLIDKMNNTIKNLEENL